MSGAGEAPRPNGAGDRWRVEVDATACVGSAQCVHHAAHAFHLDPFRRSRPVAEETEAEEAVFAAAEYCPVEAITLTHAETGEPVYPPDA
ncbi:MULTISPECIES: ferredoxin [unclassified Streptomyces]|uniref:ferredoxin n=1 Tax=unclassified Streptomyces TaxID=2593676 RepID=UPI00190823CF|nr:ferredoxin [Streptomyces sp. HSG2]